MSGHGNPPPLSVVLVTTPSVDEGRTIARALVEERLAACGNVVPGLVSIYRWEGRIEEEAEALLILKTDPARVDALIERVTRLHPYDTPEAIALPAARVLDRYADWVRSETTEVES